MTITHWLLILFTIGAIFILTGNWLLWPVPVLLLGVALMVPLGILGIIYVRNVQ